MITVEMDGLKIEATGQPPYHMEKAGYAVIVCDSNGFNTIRFPAMPCCIAFGFSDDPLAIALAERAASALNEAARSAS